MARDAIEHSDQEGLQSRDYCTVTARAEQLLAKPSGLRYRSRSASKAQRLPWTSGETSCSSGAMMPGVRAQRCAPEASVAGPARAAEAVSSSADSDVSRYRTFPIRHPARQPARVSYAPAVGGGHQHTRVQQSTPYRSQRPLSNPGSSQHARCPSPPVFCPLCIRSAK